MLKKFVKLFQIIIPVLMVASVCKSNYVHWQYSEIPRPPQILSPCQIMVDVTNDLTYRVLYHHLTPNRNNFAFSPTALGSVLIALYEGSDGRSSAEIHHALHLPWNRDIVRIGYRDIHRRLRTYLYSQENPLIGLSLNRENVCITPEYETILKFYGYDLGTDMITSRNKTYTAMPTPKPTTPAPKTTTECPTTTDDCNTTTVVDSTTMETTTTECETTTMGCSETDATTTECSPTDTSTTDCVTSDMTTTESPMTDSTTTECSPTDTSTTDCVTSDMTTTESPMTDSTTTECSPTDTSTTECVTTDMTTTESPMTDSTTTECSPTDTSTTECLTTDMTTTESPMTDATTTESPMTDSTTTECSPTDTSTTECGTSDMTTTESPMTDSTTTECSPTDTSTTECVTTDMTTTESPMTDPTTTESPMTDSTTTECSPTDTSTPDCETTDNPTTEETDPASSPAPIRELGAAAADGGAPKPAETDLFPSRTRPESGINRVRRTIPLPYYKTFVYNIPFAPEPQVIPDISLFNFDQIYITPRQMTNRQVIHHVFYLSALETIQTTFKVYNSVLNHNYIPEIKSSVLELELDSKDYSLMLVIPDYNYDLENLVASLKLAPSLRRIKRSLRPRWVQAIIPDFEMRGCIFLTNDMQNMGVTEVFEPTRADFSPMTEDNRIYVKHIQQLIDVHIKTRPIDQLKRHIGPINRPIEISANHPFLFFIMDKELDIAVMAGAVRNPLNVRIQ